MQSGGQTQIVLQPKIGEPIPLVTNKDDAEVLDFTSQNGGLFAIWTLENGTQNVYIVRLDGPSESGPINQGWKSVTDGDWSIDGARLVIEAITDGKPTYYYFDATGTFLGQPAFP